MSTSIAKQDIDMKTRQEKLSKEISRKVLQDHGALFGKHYQYLNAGAAARFLAKPPHNVGIAKIEIIEIKEFINLAAKREENIIHFLTSIDYAFDNEKWNTSTEHTDDEYFAIFDGIVEKAQAKNMLPKSWKPKADRNWHVAQEGKFPSSPDQQLEHWAGHRLYKNENITLSAIPMAQRRDLDAVNINRFMTELSKADHIVSLVDYSEDTAQTTLNYAELNPDGTPPEGYDSLYSPDLIYTATIENKQLHIQKEGKPHKEIPHTSIPIRDNTPFSPTPENIKRVEEIIQSGGNVYVHCVSAVGRTGQLMMVMRCLLDPELMQSIQVQLTRDPDNINTDEIAKKVADYLYEFRSIRYMVQQDTQLQGAVEFVVEYAAQQQIKLEKLESFKKTVKFLPKEQNHLAVLAKCHELNLPADTYPQINSTHYNEMVAIKDNADKSNSPLHELYTRWIDVELEKFARSADDAMSNMTPFDIAEQVADGNKIDNKNVTEQLSVIQASIEHVTKIQTAYTSLQEQVSVIEQSNPKNKDDLPLLEYAKSTVDKIFHRDYLPNSRTQIEKYFAVMSEALPNVTQSIKAIIELCNEEPAGFFSSAKKRHNAKRHLLNDYLRDMNDILQNPDSQMSEKIEAINKLSNATHDSLKLNSNSYEEMREKYLSIKNETKDSNGPAATR